jgi:hypothetical protein
MRTWLPAVALFALLLPSPALAVPSEFRVAGSFSLGPDGRKGELVPVIVPWDGINTRGEILSCLTGPFTLKDDILTIQKSDLVVKLRFQGGAEAGWEVLEASGACTGLWGTGSYRLTTTPMLRLNGSLDLGPAQTPGAEQTPAETPSTPASP